MAIVLLASKAATKSAARQNSLVDDEWELLDPNPDIHALFLQFNDEFFCGRLSGCEVKWSPRMTLCAGVCSYDGRGGLCSIRLSQPLLKLRPRKDLVETLLHEMIHAYLFVAERNRDREGHGPQFQSWMYKINSIAGTNITIYHQFHDEVAAQRKHWWRCTGVCRNRSPYFGWVKRSMNRAPGPNDLWHDEHVATCGGRFVKVNEPENVRIKEIDRDSKSSLIKKPRLFGKSPIKQSNSSTTSSPTKTLDEYFSKSSLPTNPRHFIESPIKQSNSSTTSSPTKTLDEYFSKLPGKGHLLSGPTSVSSDVTRKLSKPIDVVTLDDDNEDLVYSDIKPKVIYNAEHEDQADLLQADDSLFGVFVSCPVCLLNIHEDLLNSHLDGCLGSETFWTA